MDRTKHLADQTRVSRVSEYISRFSLVYVVSLLKTSVLCIEAAQLNVNLKERER